jgi:hypothetical protein
LLTSGKGGEYVSLSAERKAEIKPSKKRKEEESGKIHGIGGQALWLLDVR